MTEQAKLKFSAWVAAARPRTLPAAAAPVFVAIAFAYRDGVFHWPSAIACLLISFFMQIVSNFANDVFDYERGSDTPDRLGPIRATASGMISPREMYAGIAFVTGLAVLLGLYLVWLRGWPVVALGVAIIIGALAYTGGPFPYGYYALGDIFVLVFFGIVAVAGTYYAQSGLVTWPVILVSIPVGLMIVNILVVNNTRDMETDAASNKRTLAVLLGREAMHREYLLCLLVSYLAPLLFVLLGTASWTCLFTWASIPKAITLYRQFRQGEGRSLNKILGETARLALIYSLLFACGMVVSRWLG